MVGKMVGMAWETSKAARETADITRKMVVEARE